MLLVCFPIIFIFPSPCLNHKNLAGNFCTGSAFPFRLPPKGTQNQGQIEEVPEPKGSSLIPLLLSGAPHSLYSFSFPPCLSCSPLRSELSVIIIKNGRIEVFIFSWTLQSGQFFDLLFEEDKIDLRHQFSLEFRSAHSFAGSWYSLNFCMHSWEIQKAYTFLCVSECFEFKKISGFLLQEIWTPLTLFFIYHKILQGRLTCTSVFKNWRPRWQSNLLFVNL